MVPQSLEKINVHTWDHMMVHMENREKWKDDGRNPEGPTVDVLWFRDQTEAWISLLMTNFLSMLARNDPSLGPAVLPIRILYMAL